MLQVTPLMNSTTFAATLLVRSGLNIGMTFHATAALTRALEQDDIEVDQQAAAMWVPPAATWITIAGGKLRQHCSGQLPSNVSRAASGSLWHGGNEFSLERWSFWKRRFQELAAATSSSEDVRTYATGAASHMAILDTEQGE